MKIKKIKTKGIESPKWYCDFRFKDERFKIPAFENEEASEELGRTIKRLIQVYHSTDVMPTDLQRAVDRMPGRVIRKLAKIGILSDCKAAAGNSIEEHIKDFKASLNIKRCSKEYVFKAERLLTRICKDCSFKVLSDFNADRFTAYINNKEESVKTKRHYISGFKQFAKWLNDTGKLAKNDFNLIETPRVLQADMVHPRRALTADEVTRLIAAAENGKTWRGISGRERALIYRLAVESGLRYNEIKTLRVCDFNFKENTVSVTDANEKARRGAVLPLRESTAEALKSFLKGKLPAARAFTLKKGYLMLKTDLEATAVKDAAGNVIIKAIEYEVDGQFCDFHALRHTAASLLIQTGANPKIIQTLMRHTDINLTLQKYTHLYAGEKRNTIESLPTFEIKMKLKTGTDDCIANNTEANRTDNTRKVFPQFSHKPIQGDTKGNNTDVAIMQGNGSFDALNCKESAFSAQKDKPDFRYEKSGREDLNLRPLRPERSALIQAELLPGTKIPI